MARDEKSMYLVRYRDGSAYCQLAATPEEALRKARRHGAIPLKNIEHVREIEPIQ